MLPENRGFLYFFVTFFTIFVLPAAHGHATVRTSPSLLTLMLWGLAAASQGCDLSGLAFWYFFIACWMVSPLGPQHVLQIAITEMVSL